MLVEAKDFKENMYLAVLLTNKVDKAVIYSPPSFIYFPSDVLVSSWYAATPTFIPKRY
jgi:hypothetical protein